ncbi:hypothetical protein HNR02_003666 [Amycolatopsis endophytica]|uniref:Uncharacterized protein n=1 Tax=Amycolatopsis endophytica TaxID=860233 RepID=A0A853B539_9PSEU|nr:hypothetical protein [Amycolatopsis endophytica]NYI90343.1 hypothetical protein [Amycolatopsis endophytica]
MGNDDPCHWCARPHGLDEFAKAALAAGVDRVVLLSSSAVVESSAESAVYTPFPDARVGAIHEADILGDVLGQRIAVRELTPDEARERTRSRRRCTTRSCARGNRGSANRHR